MTERLPIDQLLSRLTLGLRGAATFEQAATITLEPMLELAAAALASSAFAGAGRIVRAMLHLRPDDGYQRLVVLEEGASAVSAVGTSGAHLPSTTAWRWVAESQRAISVDVNIGRVQLEGAEEPGAVASDPRFGETSFASQESRARLMQRDASHLYVVPLRGSRGRIDGMISLEAECRKAMGRPFIWAACGAGLQLIADLAAPYLASFPVQSVASRDTDEHLPVVGSSMASLVALLRVFVRQSDPILLSGPTGVGKSRLARWCHERSSVAGGPFEMLDLASLPEELQLAELFGWRKGAFTGAVRDNPGVIARAKGGTLFLDEIDNLSQRAQAGLLHVLEERAYRMLGDEGEARAADVRFIVGTDARLQEAVREKRFREDLYYRINVLPVRLPALCERADEIPLWAAFMASRHHTKRVAGGRVVFGRGVEAALLEQRWPGNLRQLDNIIRRAYAIAVMGHAGSPPPELAIEEEHVRHALAYEVPEDKSSLVGALVAAAAAFVSEAERRAGKAGVDLDLADSFKGFVLGVAIEKLGGNRDEAFRLLGREKLVASRNHHKVLKRELERVEALCAALGGDAAFPFSRDVDAERDDERGGG
jgi:DNA-binding NtrC family response regulator